MSIDKVDRVVLSADQLHELFHWRDNHKHLVRNFTPVLPEVVIRVYGELPVDVYVKKKPDHPVYLFTYFTIENNTKQVLIRFEWDSVLLGVNTLYSVDHLEEKVLDKFKESTISLYASLMAYMEHHEPQIITRTTKIKKNNKSKKASKSKKRVTYITRKEYVVDSIVKESSTPESNDKRTYTKPTHEITVRGHWRTYKSGKRVWVNPFVKNKGKQKDGKEYRL